MKKILRCLFISFFFCLLSGTTLTYSAGEIIDININLGGGSNGGGSHTSKPAPTMPDGPIFSGSGMKEGAEKAGEVLDDDISKSRDLKALVIGWVKWLLPLLALVAVIAILYAGFLYITSFGDDGQTEKAKKIILYVVGGILLLFGAYAIINTIMKGLT